MNKILLVLLASFLIQIHFFAQPNENEFISGLKTAAETSKDFAFSFNQSIDYNFDSSLTLTGKIIFSAVNESHHL